MGNKTLWAMMIVIVMVTLACTAAPVATQRPTGAAATQPPTETEPPGETQPPGETEPPSGTPEPMGPALPETPTGYTELDSALTETKQNPDGTTVPIYSGTKVTIQTQWIGGEGANFAASFADFEAATGIDVVADGVGSSHETTLRFRIEGNDPTLDLAILAQPSAVVQYGRDGRLIDVATFMDTAKLNEDFPATIGLLAGADGETWGVPYKVDVKSTVWYPIRSFEAAGYAVPATWDELKALADKIVADGNGNPWCIGMEAGTATGWQATDWVEDIMLRTTTPENYAAWIAGDLDFTSPEVTRAFELAGEMWFTPGYVASIPDITTTSQRVPMDPMFPTDGNWEGFTPGCWMQKQATWYGPDFFPDKRANPAADSQFVIGEDIGIFYFPPIDEEFGTPALGSGDTVMVIVPQETEANPTGEVRPEVKAFVQFLSTPQGTQRWIEAGSAISANQNTPTAWYEGSYKLAVGAEIVANATSFGFDASDLMPPVVGAGTFWTESVRWIESSGADLPGVLQAIENSWPAP